MRETPKNETLDRTTPLSSKDLAELKRSRSAGGEPRRVSLSFHHRHGVEVVQLGEGQSLIVGRGHPSDLVLPDESLSRQHAGFELIEGALWVEDLGSTNGTRVDGELFERLLVKPEAELTLGAVSVAVHAFSADASEGIGLESHDRFQRALSAEVARARDFGTKAALVLISGRRGREGHVSRWLPLVREKLREYDMAALYSDNTVEILLPQAGVDVAVARAEALVADEPSLSCSVGVFPDHAASSEELLEVTRTALQGVSADGGARVSVAATTGALGPGEPVDDDLVVSSLAMTKVFASARRFGDTAMPVLIQGETGTGKEVVARTIHESGGRKREPMISVNCGAIPSPLLESALFGHERGAFTGAHQQSKGIFEAAHGGTVFLDEIGEMPLQAQAALLRVLETHSFSRVGSTKEIHVDVRVIAATHRDLEAMSARGEFREDLFFRLDAMAIFIPALRERLEELEPLVQRFITSANRANGCEVEGVEEEALEMLRQYAWPGNVRELRNAIERAVVIARGTLITTEDLPQRVVQCSRGGRASERAAPIGREHAGALDLRAEVQRFETDLIVSALERTEWDKTQAANELGLPVRTLYYKMKQYDIKKPEKA